MEDNQAAQTEKKNLPESATAQDAPAEAPNNEANPSQDQANTDNPSSQETVKKADESGLPIIRAEKDPLLVKLPMYDGPLDLLLDLIKKSEMDICDIQVAEITTQYLNYLAEMKKLDLEVAGEFLVMAATLVYIKSKMLLPDETPEDDEEGDDPRAELIRKLLEYQAFKEAASELGILEHERGKVFTRQITDYYLKDLTPEDEGIDTFSANLYDLMSAFQKVITSKGRENMHEVYEEMISIEQKTGEIKAVLLSQRKVLFTQLFQEKFTRNELIATFLALLEIIRSKFAVIVQEEQFGEILIEKTEENQEVNMGEVV